MNKKTNKEVPAEIRNKLQLSKTVLEKLKAGALPSKQLVEGALRDLGEIERMLGA